MTINIQEMLANEAFRTAPKLSTRILESAKLFSAGVAGTDSFAQGRLKEAFSTSDFPHLLGAAFQMQASDKYEEITPEWQAIAPVKKVNDFRPAKEVDLFGGRESFDLVKEGEEYKGRSLDESPFEFSAVKTGNTFGLTWELRKNNQFHQLMDFPGRFGSAARATEDEWVFKQFVSATGPNASFFNSQNGNAVSNKALSHDNLLAAYKAIVKRKDKEGLPINLAGRPLNLIVPAALQFEAEALVNEPRIADGPATTKKNPLFGKFNVIVSYRVSVLDGSANVDTSWYLLPPKESKHAAIAKVTMVGEENLDIRVRRDQGERPGGGAIGLEDGSYKDDTIDFRGRQVTGGAQLSPLGTFASTGTTA